MKASIVAASLALVGIFGTAFVLRGQQPVAPGAVKEKGTISTSGTATLTVKPDAVHVYFGVQTIGKKVKEAREENSAKCKKLIEALTALKIPDLKMKTADINVELVQTNYNDPAKVPEILGYRVTNSFSVLVQDKDSAQLSQNASRVLDTALENGANFINRMIAFRHDDTQIRREGLTKAVEDALANAKALAAGAGVNVSGTFALNGQPEFSYGQGQCGLTNTLVVGGAGIGQTPVIVGDLEIVIRVNVTCTY
jgi:uncharacterized protein YggE